MTQWTNSIQDFTQNLFVCLYVFGVFIVHRLLRGNYNAKSAKPRPLFRDRILRYAHLDKPQTQTQSQYNGNN